MKKFTKSDLRDGNVVEYDNGKMRIVKGGYLYNENGSRVSALDRYDENLESFAGSIKIVRVYRVMWEREEQTITRDEKVLLENVDKRYRYIARDNDSALFLFGGKPTKEMLEWDTKKDSHFADFSIYSHLFSMVKWKDEEPWLIEYLLKLPVKEDK